EYQHAPDLNTSREKHNSTLDGKSVRLFVNLGTKDGLNPENLIRFITDMTDLEASIISRITVRELSSFFNVPSESATFIADALRQKKFNGRKVRVEEADQKPSFPSKREAPYPPKRDYNSKRNYTEGVKFQRARKPLK